MHFLPSSEQTLGGDREPALVHCLEELRGDRKARGRANDSVDSAVGTQCRLSQAGFILIGPLNDRGRRIRAKAVETAAQLALENRAPMLGASAMGFFKIEVGVHCLVDWSAG